ncbi:hypothetical protein [Vibrio splendidus]|uniref:hypothetical protein n=1 Tax=Vibrio splendidus TaxID=29497 RepID=UPI00246853F3|nr:hypothetical protein [Vibrio splendidus]MDH5933040.1 hypothetical protein [Vibrio splendidus]
MTCLKCQEKSVTDFCVKVPKKFLWFSWYGYQRQTLCREHLLSEYRKSFTTSQARLVVFSPDFEYKRKGLYQYLPTPLREFEEFALHDNKQGERKEDLIALKETFRKLRGFCEKCGKPAQVAFFALVLLHGNKNLFHHARQVIRSSFLLSVRSLKFCVCSAVIRRLNPHYPRAI